MTCARDLAFRLLEVACVLTRPTHASFDALQNHIPVRHRLLLVNE